jgi:hypothetical protein
VNSQLDYSQISGNIWGPPIEAMLHERLQTFTAPGQAHTQWSILDYLERQTDRLKAECETQIAEVRKCYVFGNDPDLESFLRSYRTLSQLLLEAVPHLRQHFGKDAILTLRAPIDASGSQTLYAVVMWPGAANDVRAALADFDNSWWFGSVRQASGNLTFTYELV